MGLGKPSCRRSGKQPLQQSALEGFQGGSMRKEKGGGEAPTKARLTKALGAGVRAGGLILEEDVFIL